MWPRIVERLQRGESVEMRPSGESMTPIIRSRQSVRIAPVDPATVVKGDVVLAKVAGNHYLHLVSAVQGDRVPDQQQPRPRQRLDQPSKVYGRVVAVDGEPLGRRDDERGTGIRCMRRSIQARWASGRCLRSCAQTGDQH